MDSIERRAVMSPCSENSGHVVLHVFPSLLVTSAIKKHVSCGSTGPGLGLGRRQRPLNTLSLSPDRKPDSLNLH